MFEAIDRNTGQKVALKRTMKVGNVISREYEILSLLKGSQNVVQLLDFFYSLDHKRRIIQNTVMEFCDFSLERKLREHSDSKEPIPIL